MHSDGTGAAGIEYLFNKQLAGKDGSLTYTVDNVGNINPSSRTVRDAANNGDTIALTIDQNLQYMTQQFLDQAVPASGARGAEAVVLDAHTGQVLTMAASGTFDAADPNTINPNAPINPPVMSAFEPGSVQKAITFAAALQQHTITPSQVISVPDSITMGGVTINDAWWHPTEQFTATGVLAESSNVGTLEIAQRLGPTMWDSYEQKFGVGQPTGIELPGESSGYLPPLNTWSASTFANLPFGQGESMTVLQLASIYQTIANHGVRVPPRIVKSITAADGQVSTPPSPAGITVITPQTALTLRTMLESVTQPGGTGVKAAIPGYRIAGKTGTAQQPDPAHGGAYSSWMNWDTFAGVAPADDPQFVVAIMVDNPAHGVEGGDVAAPLFNQIASYELEHAHIPPTGSLSKHVPLQVLRRGHPAGFTKYRVLTCRALVSRRVPGIRSTVPRPDRPAVPAFAVELADRFARLALDGADVTVTGVTAASARVHDRRPVRRRARPHAHGARYAAEAIAAGAVAVLTDAGRRRVGARRALARWSCPTSGPCSVPSPPSYTASRVHACASSALPAPAARPPPASWYAPGCGRPDVRPGLIGTVGTFIGERSRQDRIHHAGGPGAAGAAGRPASNAVLPTW